MVPVLTFALCVILPMAQKMSGMAVQAYTTSIEARVRTATSAGTARAEATVLATPSNMVAEFNRDPDRALYALMPTFVRCVYV